MTLDEACAYLGISPDDEDLDLDQLEKNYEAKLKLYDPSKFAVGSHEYIRAEKMRAEIEEACNFLLDVYTQLHPDTQKNNSNSNFFMKLALSALSIIALCCLAGTAYFVKIYHDEKSEKENIAKALNASEALHQEKYENLLREIEALRTITENSQAKNQNQQQNKYADIIERCRPSMVFIQTNRGLGSGFLVSEHGDILTNYHVIENAEYIHVTLYEGRTVNALVKDFDSGQDVALIQVRDIKTPFLRISASLPKLGEEVIAIGNPRGLVDTVSNGIASGLRTLNNASWLQFTAPISPGSSGGALINLNGEVVGMPTWLRADTGSQNLNFAVPSTILAKFLNSAINKPARALSLSIRNDSQVTKRPRTLAGIPGTKFVRQDDGYEIYLYTENIEYDALTRTASFITLWLPAEKSKAEMRKNPDFNIPPGTDIEICALLYIVNFRENKYLHLRTINYCSNGFIARDYVKPSNEFTWRTPGRGSRIDSLIKEVRKELRI